jgi:hypothetical protein
MTRASIGNNGETAGRRCGRRRGKRDLGVLDAEVIVVCAPLLRDAVKKEAGDAPGPETATPPVREFGTGGVSTDATKTDRTSKVSDSAGGGSGSSFEGGRG